MKTGRLGRADRVMAWLAAALLCILAGHALSQGSLAADREAPVARSNNPRTGPSPRHSAIRVCLRPSSSRSS